MVDRVNPDLTCPPKSSPGEVLESVLEKDEKGGSLNA